MTPKTYRIKSFGCQMNVYDGERMAELMAAQGMTATAAGEADLVVLNTCHIRERATEKVYSDIGRLRKDARKVGRDPMIAVAGCVAQAEGSEILHRAPVVDVVVGPQSYHRLPDLLARSHARRVVDTEFPVEDKFDHLPARRTAASNTSSSLASAPLSLATARTPSSKARDLSTSTGLLRAAARAADMNLRA